MLRRPDAVNSHLFILVRPRLIALFTETRHQLGGFRAHHFIRHLNHSVLHLARSYRQVTTSLSARENQLIPSFYEQAPRTHRAEMARKSPECRTAVHQRNCLKYGTQQQHLFDEQSCPSTVNSLFLGYLFVPISEILTYIFLSKSYIDQFGYIFLQCYQIIQQLQQKNTCNPIPIMFFIQRVISVFRYYISFSGIVFSVVCCNRKHTESNQT